MSRLYDPLLGRPSLGAPAAEAQITFAHAALLCAVDFGLVPTPGA